MKCFSSSSPQRLVCIRFKFIFQFGFQKPCCLPLIPMCLHFYLQRARKQTKRIKNELVEILKRNLFHLRCARVFFFAFNERRKYANCARAHNESERFKLRSHDYNYKYLRFRYQLVEWIILFAHYYAKKSRNKRRERVIYVSIYFHSIS